MAGLLLRPMLVGFSDENLLTAQEWSVRSLCFGLRKRKGAKGAEDQEEVTLTKGKEGNMGSSYREGHPRPSVRQRLFPRPAPLPAPITVGSADHISDSSEL